MQEKRKHPRKNIHPDVAFEVAGGERIEAICRDVSIGGAFLETNRPAPFGAKVTVFLRLPGLEKEVAVASTVRWTKPDGMGVQFGVMGARETHALVTMISSS